MHAKRLFIGFSLLSLLASFVATAHPTHLDGIIAIVNDNIVTERELANQVKQIKQTLRAAHTPLPDQTVLRKQVLHHLIDIKLQLQLAKKMGIEVDNQQLNQALKDIARRNKLTLSELKNAVTAQGLNYLEYRENLRKQMIIAQLQKQAVAKTLHVSDEDIQDYIKAHQQEIQQNKLYHVKHILIPLGEAPSSAEVNNAKMKAAHILQQIQQGKAFSRAALEESAGNNALEGGDLGWRKLAELPELFSRQVSKMRLQEIRGPLRANNGFHLIQLVAVKNNATSQPTNTATQQQLIRQMLMGRQFTHAVENWLQELRSNSYLKILKPELAI